MVGTVVKVDPAQRTADFVLPGGCTVCGGDLHLRLSPGDAHACCAVCHLLSSPKVVMGEGGMTLHSPPAAEA